MLAQSRKRVARLGRRPAEDRRERDECEEAGEYDSRSEATRDALRAFVTEFNRQTDLGGR